MDLIVYNVLQAFVVILLSTAYGVSGDPCTFISPCTCSTERHVIDIKPVMDKRSGEPLVTNDGNYTYFVEPCNTVLKDQVCKKISPNLVGCQISKDTKYVYGLGELNKNSVEGDPDLGTVTFVNSYPDSNTYIRTMRVEVKCTSNEEDTFQFEGATPDPSGTNYTFSLKTRYGCLQWPVNSKGISVGSVLVIIFFVLLVVYIVGGVLLNKFARRAQGAEIFPNVEFWKDFPSLVKDGILFTCRGCKSESSYEKI